MIFAQKAQNAHKKYVKNLLQSQFTTKLWRGKSCCACPAPAMNQRILVLPFPWASLSLSWLFNHFTVRWLPSHCVVCQTVSWTASKSPKAWWAIQRPNFCAVWQTTVSIALFIQPSLFFGLHDRFWCKSDLIQAEFDQRFFGSARGKSDNSRGRVRSFSC